MNTSFLAVVLLVFIVDIQAKYAFYKRSANSLSDDQGTGRLMLWRFLPQYQDVDIGANFNKLKSSGDAAFFVVRDTIVVRNGRLVIL